VPYGFDPVSGLGFKVATFTTSGASLLAGLEFSVYNLPYLEDFFLHASNMSFAYDGSAAPGARVDYSSVMIDGALINPYGSYTVAVPDGVVPFLTQIPGFTMSNLNVTSMFMYTEVRDFMTAQSPVAYYREGRIFDLAAMATPASAATELGNLVKNLRASGAITDRRAADLLAGQYTLAAKMLQRNLIIPAWVLLFSADKSIDRLVGDHRIAPDAAARLQYATGKLSDKLRSMLGGRRGCGGALADGELPIDYALEQNYPNPFNPTTTIEYGLPVDGHVTINVYNVLGQEVRRLVDDDQTAGKHNVLWDGTDDAGAAVATGVYLYRIEAGPFTASRSMLLIK
jgi:hypothetical protein